MRTGNLRGMSERDWAGIREFKEFSKQEAEKQRLAEDRKIYEAYLHDLNAEQARVPKAHRVEPLSFEEWRAFLPADQDDPVVRGAVAINRFLLTKDRADDAKIGRDAFTNDKPDPGWVCPKSAANLNMEESKVLDYINEQANLFIALNPDYFPSKKNYTALVDYLWAQGLRIFNADAFRAAWLRLLDLGIVLETWPAEPAPEPETQPDPEVVRQQQQDEYRTKIVVTDPRNGQGYTQYQLDHRVSADDYRRLVIGEFKTPSVWDVITPR